MEVNSKSLDDYSREDLIERVKSLDKEIAKLKKQKKFGLVWEDKREKVVADCDEMLPILTEVKNRTISEDADSNTTNLIIEGDNYHALSVLNYTHAGKIDVIYIGPPYNTGSKDFLFDDRYVDKEDAWRHSMWLSFMEKRLNLAKNLMSEDGVMFISIDDNEITNLKSLCDEIFGESHTDIMIWRKSGVGRDGKMKNTTTFRKDHEYILVCSKNKKYLNKIAEKPNFQNTYTNPDDDPRGPYKAGSISNKESASNKDSEKYYTVTAPSGKTFTRQFNVSKEVFLKLQDDNRIYWGKNGNSVPSIKIFVNETRFITPYSILLDKGTTTDGTKELNRILKGDYSRIRPKPSLLIKTLIQIASKKNSIVLDFFAGSGTTGQATLALNRDDGGTRQFIICTNNKEIEGRIAENITYPRIYEVTHGFKTLDGNTDCLPANVRYFKTDFVEKGESTDETRERLILRATDVIRVREGTFEAVLDEVELKVFTNGVTMTAVIFEPFQMSELWQKVEKVNREKLETHLYIFSYSSDVSAFTDEIPETEINWVSKPIPDGILKVYKKLFE